MRGLLSHFFAREEGQALAEYSVMLLLVMVVCVAAVTLFGQRIVQALLEPAAAMFP